MKQKGQFSVIAALLVSAVLITSVVVTYSIIRDNLIIDQPEALNAVDEVNFAIKQMLGFTVGYYGSVLKVTGNATDAYSRTLNYTYTGLEHLADMHPEWGTSINLIPPLEVNAFWYTNESYSSGKMQVNYSLAKLGIYGATYGPTCKLNVQVINETLSGKVGLNITKDENEQLVNLRKSNFKFYRLTADSSWELVNPSTEPTFENGVYYVDVPAGVDEQSFVIQIEDQRGIMVVSSSFNRFTITPSWNSTTAPEHHYVDSYQSDVDASASIGTHSNFTAQQADPDGIYDNLMEQDTGTTQYYPSGYDLLGSTVNMSGSLTNLSANDASYMTFRSYPSQNSTGSFGYSSTGSSTASIESYIRGSVFTLTENAWADSITVYVAVTTASKNMKCMIYRHNDSSLIATTEQRNIPVSTEWQTFTFTTKPSLTATVEYVLVAWSASGSGSANMYYASGSANQGHYQSLSYGSAPNPASFWHDSRQYRIYCNYTKPVEYTAEVEFTGTADTQAWTQLLWIVDSSLTTNSVTAIFQLYNYTAGQYPTSGDGYITATIGTSDQNKNQTITTNPTQFRNATGGWKIMIKATKATNDQFDWKIDFIEYQARTSSTYELDIEEQFTNCSYNRAFEELCIKTGAFSADSENLAVDVWNGSSWINLIGSLNPTSWNNITITSYLTSPTLTLRFRDTIKASDSTQSNWQIDATLLHLWPPEDLYELTQNTVVAVEMLQNGTIRWLGKTLQTTTAKPIPPIPVKAIHINQTIDTQNQEVSFQTEEWASEYRVPLGLASNASLFSARTMLVFLASSNVSKITVWWNGSDKAIQTPYAIYNPNTSPFKNDDPNNGFLSNGLLNLTIARVDVGYNTILRVTSKTGNMNSTADFIRINGENNTYGSAPSYVIYNGIVRDIVQTEPEWRGGAGGDSSTCTCPDLYAHIIIALPANTTYFTYTSRIMFLNSTQSTRKLSDLAITSLTATGLSPATRYVRTENGTQTSSNTGLFYNYTGLAWTHRWSQITNTTDTTPQKGTGMLFTDITNLALYSFDNETSKTGGLNISSTDKTIELLPVKRYETQDFHAQQLDLTWSCAIVTFDDTTPIYTETNGISLGLWIVAEYPPTVAVETET